MREDVKRKLLYMGEMLRKYCHKPGCKYFYAWPDTCECRPRIGLDTTIVWTCKVLVHKALITDSISSDDVEIIKLLLSIIEQHAKEYPKASMLLRTVYQIACEVNDSGET